MRWFVFWIDGLVRRSLGVYEFSDDPDCLLRLQVKPVPHRLELPLGVVEKGEPVLGIHLWNERVRPIPPTGPDLAWSLSLRRSFERSLHLVGREMRRDPRLRGVLAVGAVTGALVPGEASSGVRVMRHLGFTVGPMPPSRLDWLTGFWRNVYAWWLLWAYNPASLRRRTFADMGSTEMWMNRAEFLKRYGGSDEEGRAEDGPGQAAERKGTGAVFRFLDPGSLVDGDLELVLYERYWGDPAQGKVPAYRFLMTRVGDGEELGSIELRVGNTDNLVVYAGQIGYGVEPLHRGHRYAARAVRLLLPLARRHGLNPIWITCNPDNAASRRTCELTGATLVETVDLPPDHEMRRQGERQKCRYRLDVPPAAG